MRQILRGALPVCLLLLSAGAAFGQAGIAQRTSLGTSLGVGADGVPRYREDTGWNSANFGDTQWAVEYGTQLNGGAAWASVLQGNRSNASFTAATNNLVLDLNGFTYNVKPYLSGGVAVAGQFVVTDRNGTGSSLKVVNGTIDNTSGSAPRLSLGSPGQTGRLTIENATFKTFTAAIGDGAGATGNLTLNANGALSATRLWVGPAGVGMLDLHGPGATAEAPSIVIGTGGTGTVTLNDPGALLHAKTTTVGTGNLSIENPIPVGPGDNVGLRVNSGTVQVDGNLGLSQSNASAFGAVEINGGTVKVGGTVSMGTGTTDTNGGKVFLNGGRFEVTAPTAVNFTPPAGAGAGTKQFYWNAGTLAFSSANVTLSDTQLKSFTTQGAASYGGGRAAGTLITGQTLDAAGALTLTGGAVTLAGGTIKAGSGLVVNSSITGGGTIGAVVSGTGALNQSGPSALAIGALGGANTVTGNNIQVGHLGVDATHTGAITSGGIVTKVGSGTQTFQGSVQANDGLNVNAGKVAFSGNGATLNTSPLRISAGATARFQSGATGSVFSATTNAPAGTSDGGRLQVDGAATRLTASVVTNNGWIELTNGGTLTVGSAASPGSLVNNGMLINGGTLTAAVTGSGTISGSGTFAGSVTVAGGGILAPGNSPGTASFADLTFGPGGSYALELASATGTPGASWDLAAVSGLLDIAATSANPFTLVLKSLTGSFAPGALAGFDPTRPFSWKFASVTDPSKLVGFDPSKFAFDATDFVAYNGLAGGSFSVSSASDGVYVNFSPQPAAAPEPGSVVLLTLAGLSYAGCRLRRRPRPASA